jgi:hypothetical protein
MLLLFPNLINKLALSPILLEQHGTTRIIPMPTTLTRITELMDRGPAKDGTMLPLEIKKISEGKRKAFERLKNITPR